MKKIMIIGSAGIVTADSSVEATNLGIKALGDVTFNDASNDVDILAAVLSSDAALSFVDSDGVTIGVVGSGDDAITGITDGEGTSNMTLTTGGLLTQAVGALVQIDGNIGPIRLVRMSMETPQRGYDVDIRYDNLKVRTAGPARHSALLITESFYNRRSY